MTFRAPFKKAFSRPFGGEIIAVPRWLTGGIPVANCLAAFEPKGATNLANSYINKNTPGIGDCTLGTAPTWDATSGWKFAGVSSQYLITAVPMGSTTSVIVRFSNSSGSNTMVGSRTSGNNGIFIRPTNATGLRYVNGAQLDVLPTLVAGVLAISGKNVYRNGVSDGTIGAGNNTNTNVAYISALNSTGVPGTYWTGYIQAIYFYNIAIDPYVVALTAAMNAL